MADVYEHRCMSMDNDIRIIAKVSQTHRDSGHPKTIREYWIMKWNFEDSNDPCYGTLEIKYCPYCGKKL